MSINEDPYADVEIIVLDEESTRRAIGHALAEAGFSWEELQEQARVGKFASEIAREVWFVVSSLVEPSAA